MDKKTSPSPAPSSKATGKTESLSDSFRIRNELGLHARAAAQFVKVASRFRAEVTVQKSGQSVNGKSIMGILMLAASKGSDIRLTIKGPDAPEAMEALATLIKNGFGEQV